MQSSSVSPKRYPETAAKPINVT